MANVFLNGADRDIETAIMLEQAIIHDIGNAVAYTDGDRIFINTDDNLYRILPAYDHKMLKWLLWHERYHKELRHHNRFFRFLDELKASDVKDKFSLTKDEVNIIMDILVHDSLAKLFPELIETAVNNLAQMRNRNSLDYTFKTFTLEEMLDEFKKSKSDDDGDGAPTDEKADDDGIGTPTKGEKRKGDKGDGDGEGEPKDGDVAHGEGGGTTDSKTSRPESKVPEIKDEPEPEPEHHKTDWSKLEKIDSKEFIDINEADRYVDQINRLKRKQFKLGKLTETLNGLTTTTRKRSYTMPSPIHIGGGVLIKGSTPGKTLLYLCFDASGSMGVEMETFKEIISKSIPQAMDTPTTWFSGWGSDYRHQDPDGRNSDYFKGKFKDFMPVRASSGYSDDGDRTIEMCWKAEQLGYSPIGVTDGGGQISWAKDKLKQLKRTILVGQNKYWLKEAKEINPMIQTLDI